MSGSGGINESVVTVAAGVGIDVWSLPALTHVRSIAQANISTTAVISKRSLSTQPLLIAGDMRHPTLHITALPHTASDATRNAHLHSWPYAPTAMADSHSSKDIFVIGSNDGDVTVYHRNRLVTWRAHYKRVSVIHITADAQFIITAADDTLIHVWSTVIVLSSTVTPMPVHCTFAAHSLSVTALCQTPLTYNSPLISVSLDRSICIHSIAQQKTVNTTPMPSALTTCALAIADGATSIWCGSQSGEIYVLTMQTSSYNNQSPSFVTLSGHTAAVTGLVANTTSSLLISSSMDGTIRLWDARALVAIKTATTHAREHYGFVAVIAPTAPHASATITTPTSNELINISPKPRYDPSILMIPPQTNASRRSKHSQQQSINQSYENTLHHIKMDYNMFQQQSSQNITQSSQNGIETSLMNGHNNHLHELRENEINQLRQELEETKKRNAQLYTYVAKHILQTIDSIDDRVDAAIMNS